MMTASMRASYNKDDENGNSNSNNNREQEFSNYNQPDFVANQWQWWHL